MSHIWAIYFHTTLLCIYAIQLQIITYKHLSVVTHCLHLELYPHISAKNHHKSLHFHHRSQWSTFNGPHSMVNIQWSWHIYVIHHTYIYSNYTFISHNHIIFSFQLYLFQRIWPLSPFNIYIIIYITMDYSPGIISFHGKHYNWSYMIAGFTHFNIYIIYTSNKSLHFHKSWSYHIITYTLYQHTE